MLKINLALDDALICDGGVVTVSLAVEPGVVVEARADWTGYAVFEAACEALDALTMTFDKRERRALRDRLFDLVMAWHAGR